jgi:hypothetical protein
MIYLINIMEDPDQHPSIKEVVELFDDDCCTGVAHSGLGLYFRILAQTPNNFFSIYQLTGEDIFDEEDKTKESRDLTIIINDILDLHNHGLCTIAKIKDLNPKRNKLHLAVFVIHPTSRCKEISILQGLLDSIRNPVQVHSIVDPKKIPLIAF